MAEYTDKYATAEHIDMYAKLLTMGDYRSGMMKAKEILLNQECVQVTRCKDCYHNNDCDIQYAAHAGDSFFCGFGETKEDIRKDLYE